MPSSENDKKQLHYASHHLITLVREFIPFLWFENQVSLILGKNYPTLNVVFRNIDLLKTDDKDLSRFGEIRQCIIDAYGSMLNNTEIFKIAAEIKTQEATVVIKESITDIHSKYKNLVPLPKYLAKTTDNSECTSFGANVIKFLNNTLYSFEFFISAYNKLCGHDQTKVFEGPMKEFGNFMAHLVIGCASEVKNSFDNNLQKADSHLFRGALDCYKLFIIDKYPLLLGQPDLYNELLELRCAESGLIGEKENGASKQALLQKYETFCNKIP